MLWSVKLKSLPFLMSWVQDDYHFPASSRYERLKESSCPVFLEYAEWFPLDCHRMSSGFLTHPRTVLVEWMCPELLSSAILSKVSSILQPVIELLNLRKLTWTGKPDFSANYLCLFQLLSRARGIYSCSSWFGLPELLAGVLRSWALLGIAS